MTAVEKDFEIKIKRWLASIGVYDAGTPRQKMTAPPVGWFFKAAAGPFQKAGIPDLIACVNGQFVAIEVKSPTGVASELQALNVKRIQQAGGYAVILKPHNFEAFKATVLGLLPRVEGEPRRAVRG